MKIKRVLQGVFWVLVYLALTMAPLYFMLFSPGRPEGREFWRELSVSLGFVGLAMMALQFVLTARFKFLKAPYGSDIVYYFHRQISLVTFALIAAHPILLFIFDPSTLRLLNLFSAPWRARAAVTAFAALIVLIAISVWRKRWKIDYTRWRIWHGALAALAVSLAMVHVVLVGHYMNTPAKRVLWISYAAFWIFLLIYVRVIKPLMLLRRPYQVEQVAAERGNAYTLALAPVGHAGVRFMPGQFAWLTARSSPFADTEHPFSISSSAARDDGRLTFTIKELGDFTRTIRNFQPGERVYVDGAYGAFSVDRHPHAAGYVFIAGGVGITPMMSMLRTLADRGDHRPLTLIYAARDLQAATFYDEIETLKARLNLKVIYVLDTPPADWEGEKGFITADLLDRHLPTDRRRDQYEIFICGPQPMMDAVEAALVKLGVDLGDFHSERFDLV